MKFTLRKKLTHENVMAYEPMDLHKPKVNLQNKLSKLINKIHIKIKHVLTTKRV